MMSEKIEQPTRDDDPIKHKIHLILRHRYPRVQHCREGCELSVGHRRGSKRGMGRRRGQVDQVSPWRMLFDTIAQG